MVADATVTDDMPYPRFRVAIDRGGTFTDIVATVAHADGRTTQEVMKLLSHDPDHYEDAPSEGIRRVMRKYLMHTVSATGPISATHLEEVRMGTTVATNALLEHKGERCVIVLTEGFEDLLDIRDQTRPQLFALNIVKARVLPEQMIGAKERVRPVSLEEQLQYKNTDDRPATWVTCGESYVMDVIATLDEAHMRRQLQSSFDAGIRSVAVCLIHAYAYTEHERRVGAIAQAIGYTNISLSHKLTALVKYVPRSITASVDAYLSPLIREYVANFCAQFTGGLAGVRLYFIQSDGGLTCADSFFGYRAVLSGPAGGVVGCAHHCSADLGQHVQAVGFDMGGTSTDISRFKGNTITHTVEAEIAGTPLQAPQVQVHTVAAGGGSILTWENGMFCVGPSSAGSHPGPACYGKGGPLTVTDANVVLGRLDASFFPCVFGPNANEPLNKVASLDAFAALTKRIAQDTGKAMTLEEVALAFIAVANEAMCRPIRSITESSGYRCSDHVLAVFGGAGGQHACAMARSLGMTRIFLHRLCSLLSAVGTSISDVVEEHMASCHAYLRDERCISVVNNLTADLAGFAKRNLRERGFGDDHIVVERYLSMKYEGTNTSLLVAETGEVPEPQSEPHCEDIRMDDLRGRFEELYVQQYKRQFGFLLSRRRIIVDGVRVRARGLYRSVTMVVGAARSLSDTLCHEEPYSTTQKMPPTPHTTTSCYFSTGWQAIPVFQGCATNGPIVGPALIVLEGTSVLVEHHSIAYTNDNGNLVVHTGQVPMQFTTALHPLPLSIFAHRFMSIAEQMGSALQRTSISTNIKERLDFSCALFDPEGNLVANAPHIPVHLGAMGAAVKWQREYYGDQWREGDVLLSNHPACGGSHLPDITVMSAFFYEGRVIFYVASRGHHADVGGTTPGSMPPFSKSLVEEGAAIRSLKLIENGEFNEEGVHAALLAPGQFPGMSGCRTVEDSISDLRAQVAANNRGIQLLQQLIETYGLEVVQAYMIHIQAAAESAARGVLRDVAQRYGTQLTSVDFMDDGTPIQLSITIDADTGTAGFDFSGTGSQVLSSTNCPTAVVHSAIIYCVRCLVASDVPLNQGCMKPITVTVEPGSLLHPDEDLPVVAGNVTTSQRVTDVVFMALRAAACSHGCMNNFTFGDDACAYYETICGGSGAGPSFHGASAVQTHMTNTRLTDPEILETRYPVLLRAFHIRRGSGGRGRFNGGDGVVRSFIVLRDLTVVLLTERRVLPPKGLYDGGDGKCGLNMLYTPTSDGRTWTSVQSMLHDPVRGPWLHEEDSDISTTTKSFYRPRNIGGKNIVRAVIGDIITIHTAGGGGCYPVEAP